MVHNASCSEEEFIALFEQHGANDTAKLLGCTVRSVYIRRKNIEKRSGQLLTSPNNKDDFLKKWCGRYAMRFPLGLPDGIALIGSDCHYQAGRKWVAHRGFVHLAKELKPALTILNGDVKDGAAISRHMPLAYEKKTDVKTELEAIDERVSEIRDATPKATRIWTLGNHDMRFEARLAAVAPEFKGVKGFSLGDHFRDWKIILSAWINDDVVVKHRFRSGVHATFNNVVKSGKTIVTGHLHQLKVTPYDDYRPHTRFGIDSGTMEDPYGPHADYGEDNPLDHRSGFVVLTFHKGRLLWPEIAAVVDEKHIQFRGKLIKV